MVLIDLLAALYNKTLVESVFDVLGTISDNDPTRRQYDILSALVMFVLTNNQRPGILQLKSFYSQDNNALFNELDRLISNHTEDFDAARKYVAQHGIQFSKNLVQRFFAAKQNNVDLAPRSIQQGEPQLPQRPVGGDRGRMKIAGR